MPEFQRFSLRRESRRRFNRLIGTFRATRRADGNEIAMMSPWYCLAAPRHVQCFLAPVNVAATGSGGARNDTPTLLHCSVNLASFQGIQFSSSFRTKYVIAIRARNTFLATTIIPTDIVRVSIVVRVVCTPYAVLPRCRIYAVPLWTTKRGSRSRRDLVFLLWAPRRDCQRILR